jgi:hypothetical protein
LILISYKRDLCIHFAVSFQEQDNILPACVYPYFSAHDGYEFLPFKHVDLYQNGISPDLYSLIIPLEIEIRTSFRLNVCERMCAHMMKDHLFDIDIE